MTDRETLKAQPAEQVAVQEWINTVWYLWQSNGAHYAVRRGRLTDSELQAGYERTVPADSPEELRGLLLKQPDAPNSLGRA